MKIQENPIRESPDTHNPKSNEYLKKIKELSAYLGHSINNLLAGKPDHHLRPGEIYLGRTLDPLKLSTSMKVSQIKLSDGTYCLLLHARKKTHSGKKRQEIEHQYALDTADGARLLEDDTPWTQFGVQGTPTFNCHTYALGERAGLTPDDIVAGRPWSDYDNNHNPMQALLNEYFSPVFIDKFGPDINWNRCNSTCQTVKGLMKNEHLLPGDLITFTNRGNLLFDENIINHVLSGRIIKNHSGENEIACKAGEGPIMTIPLFLAVKRALENQSGFMFDCGLEYAQVYRPKNEM